MKFIQERKKNSLPNGSRTYDLPEYQLDALTSISFGKLVAIKVVARLFHVISL